MALVSEQSFNGLTNQNRNVQLRIPAVALADLADGDDRIVAASADLKVSTQLSAFEERHPDRFFQFGISERNMMAAAAGMASCGILPYVGTFASFSGLMCLENIRTDMAYPNMPVRVLATHAGVACGYFAVSHHATEDISAVRAVANLMIVSPCDGNSAAALIRSTVGVPGPIYMRLGRGRENPVYPDDVSLVPGAPTELRSGAEVLIAATGTIVQEALDASTRLKESGISATVLDVHTLKPFPDAAVAELAARHRALVAVEEHNTLGGLGTMTIEAVASSGIATPVYKHGLYDEYAIIGSPIHLYEYYGLDGPGIATIVRRVLDLVDAGTFADRPSTPLWTQEDRAAAMGAVRARSSPANEAPAMMHQRQ